MERIILAKEYRVAEWLRDAYLELTQERLWAREPYSSWETDAEEWEATTSRDWESLARIFYFQAKVVASFIDTGPFSYEYVMGCNSQCDGLYADTRLCKCRLLPMVDEAFGGELESLRKPLPCKLPISYLCPLKTILYSQQHRQRSRLKEEKEKSDKKNDRLGRLRSQNGKRCQ